MLSQSSAATSLRPGWIFNPILSQILRLV